MVRNMGNGNVRGPRSCETTDENVILHSKYNLTLVAYRDFIIHVVNCMGGGYSGSRDAQREGR